MQNREAIQSDFEHQNVQDRAKRASKSLPSISLRNQPRKMLPLQSRERKAAPTIARRKFRTMVTSTYDVHNICNLKCEGCSYFVTDRKPKLQPPSQDDYDIFFAQEVARGVNYPIFSGAEPSLNQMPLQIAARHWNHGAIFTNGVKRINAELPFRIVISLWSGRDKSRTLRGADAYQKALRSAAADRRAIVFFTINSQSVEDIPEVVNDCASLGIPISFNFYSMTSEYRRRVEANATNDENFFRFSNMTDNLSLSGDNRRRAVDLIEQLTQRFPKIVLFHRSLGQFMAQEGAMHRIDPETGLAMDCAVFGARTHLSFNYDLTRDDRKDCCAPDFDCQDCRVLGAALASLMMRTGKTISDPRAAAQEVRELRQLMMQLYYWDWESANAKA